MRHKIPVSPFQQLSKGHAAETAVTVGVEDSISLRVRHLVEDVNQRAHHVAVDELTFRGEEQLVFVVFWRGHRCLVRLVQVFVLEWGTKSSILRHKRVRKTRST